MYKTVISSYCFFTSRTMKVPFKGRMLPKQFDTSRDAGRMYLIILRIKSNQINLALRVRSLITGLSTCLLQQHSLALPSWHLIALTFTRWLTTPEGSYEANAGFHWYVSSIRFHWGGDLLQRFIFTVNLWTSAGAQPVEGDGMTPCPFPIQGRIPWGGGGSNTCQVRLSQLKTQKGRHVDCYDCEYLTWHPTGFCPSAEEEHQQPESTDSLQKQRSC